MGSGIGDATQALGWALAWSRCAEHPLRTDRVRPTTRAVAALTRAVVIVAGWGTTPMAEQFAGVNVTPVADYVRQAMESTPAGWFVTLRSTWRHLRHWLPGVETHDTFRRRMIDAPPGTMLADLWVTYTDRGFPAEAVIALQKRLSR